MQPQIDYSKYAAKLGTTSKPIVSDGGFMSKYKQNKSQQVGQEIQPKTNTALERLNSPEFKQQAADFRGAVGSGIVGAGKDIFSSISNAGATPISYAAAVPNYVGSKVGTKLGEFLGTQKPGAAKNITFQGELDAVQKGMKETLPVNPVNLSKEGEAATYGGQLLKGGVTVASLANPAMGLAKGAGMGLAYGTGDVLAEKKTGMDAVTSLGVNTVLGGVLGPIGKGAKAGLKTAGQKKLIKDIESGNLQNIKAEDAKMAYDEVSTKLKENVKNKIFGSSMALKNTRSAMELNKDVLAEDVISKYAGKYGLPESIVNPVTNKASYRTVGQIKNVEKDLNKQEEILLSRLAADKTETSKGQLYQELKNTLDNSEYANNSSVYQDFLRQGQRQIDAMFALNKQRAKKDTLKFDTLNREKSAQYNNSSEWGTRPGQQKDADLASLLGRTYKNTIEKYSKVPGIGESNKKIGELIDYKTILKQIDNKAVPTSADALGEITDSSTNPYLAGALTYGATGDTLASAGAGAAVNSFKKWLNKRALNKELKEPLLNETEKRLLQATYKKINSDIPVTSLTPDATKIPITDARGKLPVTHLQNKPRPVPVDGKVNTPVDVPFKSQSVQNKIPVKRVQGKGDVPITPDKDLPKIDFGDARSKKAREMMEKLKKKRK